jgi:hypothetical protein
VPAALGPAGARGAAAPIAVVLATAHGRGRAWQIVRIEPPVILADAMAGRGRGRGTAGAVVLIPWGEQGGTGAGVEIGTDGRGREFAVAGASSET